MSNMTHDEISEDVGDDQTVDFMKVVSSVLDRFSWDNVNLEVINDQMQLRIVFTPEQLSVNKIKDEIKDLSETAVTEAETTYSYTVDLFEDHNDVVAVFSPKNIELN